MKVRKLSGPLIATFLLTEHVNDYVDSKRRSLVVVPGLAGEHAAVVLHLQRPVHEVTAHAVLGQRCARVFE